MKKKPTFISFFSGIEGFRVGLEAAGWRCVHSVEIDDFCGKVQEARYGHRPQSRDIIKLKARDLPDADLWVAGWPCQGLSVAGLRKGLSDARSGLFWEFVRLLEQKRPRRLLAENVPGLLTTCSCRRCGYQCKKCGAPAGAEDEACQLCGSENLWGRVLPAHRGTDFFVVCSALQRVGYGLQTRILDAQYLGVPQRRNRIIFAGNLGAPCPPEILFEPQSGPGDLAARRKEGKIASGELARSIGAVGGGNDPGANKGTLVKPKVAHSVTASAGHHGHSSPRGDGSDNLIAATLGTNHRPDRGQKGENIVASTLQSPAGGQRTTEVDNLIGPIASSDKAHALSKGTGGGLGGRDGQDDYVIRMGHASSDPLVAKRGVTDSLDSGTGHGGCANQAIARHEVFETRFARNGRGKPSGIAPPLKAQSGRTGKGDGAPCVVGPTIAAPLTAGSHPNSHMAGRRREDDLNIVQQPLFIHLADSGMNQGQVKKNGKADCLSKAQPGAVAFDPTNSTVDPGAVSPPLKAGSGGASGHHAAVTVPEEKDRVMAFHSTGGGHGISDQELSPPLTVGTGLDIPSPPAVAYNVKGMAHGGKEYAYETEKTGTVDTDGRNPSGNEAGTLVGPTPMSIRRLTPTEAERLQGFPCGWTCTCGVRPDCPDRRIPPWLDPSTFKLGGCGHSACGCTCADSPRYKSLGNAVATCVVFWVGRRLKAVEF